jgi:hypothetical protein
MCQLPYPDKKLVSVTSEKFKKQKSKCKMTNKNAKRRESEFAF